MRCPFARLALRGRNRQKQMLVTNSYMTDLLIHVTRLAFRRDMRSCKAFCHSVLAANKEPYEGDP